MVRSMRRGQAAVEYLFMLTIALLMVLLAVRLIAKTTQTATRQINQTTQELLSILENMTRGQS
jgi:ABC-type transporter MlaC component